ncbi:MAG: cytochrome c oxidase subunit II, partial [Myxococcales bacterium]|nr:cytochrome c oxidase subunit II [Myxococcales bacterium]
MREGTLQLPPQLSTLAPEVDGMYYAIFWWSVILFVLIVGAMLFFVVKYRRRPGHEARPTGHSTLIEVLWTFAPLLLLAYFFHRGFTGYMDGVVAPANAIDIRARAMQWNWEFTHQGEVRQMNELTIPVGQPVRMIMSSSDVLHAFFIPEFRVKKDVVPGMFTTLWFEATETTEEPLT